MSDQYWIECVDSFDYEPYGRQGPFVTRDEAQAACDGRRAELQRSQANAGSLRDRVHVYSTADPNGEPRLFSPYTVRGAV